MASIQTRHSRACAIARPWTSFLLPAGCDCKPTYYAVSRVGGKLIRERIGKNRKVAERALARVVVAVDEGTYVVPSVKTFAEWVDEWEAGLRRPGESTRYSYKSTIKYAKTAFGQVKVRNVGPAHIAAMLTTLAEGGLSPSTMAKHLRVLHSCFEVATRRGLMFRNPVNQLEPAEKPRACRLEAAWFEDNDLATIAAKMPEGAYRVAFRLCLASGLRQGEAIALTWGDVSFTQRTISVRRSFTVHGDERTKAPKSGQWREVHVTDDLLMPLAEWWRELGKPGDDTLVVPGPDGYLKPRALLRKLVKAMEDAGVPATHPRTGASRNWHSLRHTYARLALQGGTSLSWLQGQLGHSSPAVTAIYQHWADEGKRQQAKLLEGVFVI